LGDASGEEGRIPRERVEATGFIGKAGVIVAMIDGVGRFFPPAGSPLQRRPPLVGKDPPACTKKPVSEKLPKPQEQNTRHNPSDPRSRTAAGEIAGEPAG